MQQGRISSMVVCKPRLELFQDYDLSQKGLQFHFFQLLQAFQTVPFLCKTVVLQATISLIAEAPSHFLLYLLGPPTPGRLTS